MSLLFDDTEADIVVDGSGDEKGRSEDAFAGANTARDEAIRSSSAEIRRQNQERAQQGRPPARRALPRCLSHVRTDCGPSVEEVAERIPPGVAREDRPLRRSAQ